MKTIELTTVERAYIATTLEDELENEKDENIIYLIKKIMGKMSE